MDPVEPDPLNLLSDLRQAQDLSNDDEQSTASLQAIYRHTQDTVVAALQKEKLEIGNNGASYLSSVLKEASAIQTSTSNSLTEVERAVAGGLSESVSRTGGVEPDLSRLTNQLATMIHGFCQREDPTLGLRKIIPELIRREMNGESPERFWGLPSIDIELDLRAEKLVASKETACFLKQTLGYCTDIEHGSGTDGLFEEVMSCTADRRRDMSPVYISPIIQPCDESDCHDNTELDQDVKFLVADNLDQPHKSIESKYISSETTSTTNEPKPVVVDGNRLTPTSDRVYGVDGADNSTEAVPESIKAGGLGLKSPIRSPTSQKIMHSKANTVRVPISLGTLSSFMQTRGHESKRRRVDTTSSYFNNAAPTRKSDSPTEETNSKIRQCDHQPMPSDTPSLYPQSPLPNPTTTTTTTTLLLILSTSLLHTNRRLINSLESLPSPTPRLIFRDYSLSNSATGEADIITSPQTGIILTTAQQTTQTHLPGHGSPGLSSPLQERTVRVAPRYENLYILVQVPSSLDSKSISSIRELSAFCLSLSQMCTIQTLLVPQEHNHTTVLAEWVLAIATKHVHNMPGSTRSSSEEGEGKPSPWSSYLDEQTQWELFLRRAGLNPFAAQSVLDILRNKNTHSIQRNSDNEDDGQVHDLCRFIEMSRQARRELFQDTVGVRVLTRVENAVEMDWQVEWAC